MRKSRLFQTPVSRDSSEEWSWVCCPWGRGDTIPCRHPVPLARGPRWGAHSTLTAWAACLLSAVPREAEMWAFFRVLVAPEERTLLTRDRWSSGCPGILPERYWAIRRTNLVQMLRSFSLAGCADYLGVSSGWKSLGLADPISDFFWATGDTLQVSGRCRPWESLSFTMDDWECLRW